MRLPLLFPLLACAASPVLPAQADMSPAKELAKLERLVGSWQGTGTVVPAPGVPAIAWTSRVVSKKALGGHFIREDTVIEFGDAMPGKLSFVTFHGWDRENRRYMSWGISNVGATAATELHWVDDDTLVTIEVSLENGKTVIDRWTTKLGRDRYSILGQRAIGTDDWMVHVQGTFERTKVRGRPALASGAFGPTEGDRAGRMELFAMLAGDYDVKGAVTPAPGAPEMPITGTETQALIYGGTVLEMRIEGSSAPGMPPYEAWGAVAWNPTKNCYVNIWVDNMGMAGSGEARRVGKDIVFTNMGMRFGQPLVGRMVWTCGPKGIEKTTSYVMVGAGDPVVDFRATYTRKK